MLLLKQNIVKTRQIENVISRSKFKNNDNNNDSSDKYKFKKIYNSIVYIRQSEIEDHLLGIDYPIL